MCPGKKTKYIYQKLNYGQRGMGATEGEKSNEIKERVFQIIEIRLKPMNPHANSEENKKALENYAKEREMVSQKKAESPNPTLK